MLLLLLLLVSSMFTLAHASIVSLAVQAPHLARQRQAHDLARKFHKDFDPLDLDNHLRTGQPDITETALLKMCTFFKEAGIDRRFCFKAMRSCALSVSDKDFANIWRRSKSSTENPEIKTTGTDEMFTLADACAVFRAVQAPELESQAHDLARKFHNEFNPLDHIHLRSDQPDLPKAALLKMCALFQEEGIDKHVCFTAMKSCAPSATDKDLDYIWRTPQVRISQSIRRSPIKVKENAADLHGAGPMQMQIQGAVPLMAEASVLPFVAARTDTGKVRTLPLMAWSSAENERRKNSRVTQE
jgi:hypothetical protein